MKFLLRKAGLGLAAVAVLIACRKQKYELEGPTPQASFTVTVDASQYPTVATFTSTSTDAFLYQWDFGDGTTLGSGSTVKHTYKSAGGTFRAKLTVSGKGGTGISAEQAVLVPDLCGTNNGFAVLTACAGSGATSWILSDQPGAIKKYAANGTTLLSSSTAPLLACQADDEFSFTSSFTYSYGAGTVCSGVQASSNADFVYRPGSNQIVLQLPAGTKKSSFIGAPDTVQNRTYTIVQATATVLKLRGTNYDGTITESTFMPQLSALERTKAFLTGGSSRTWVLDNTVDKTIIVGTEAAPTSYYAGGPLAGLPACQADDEFTFTSSNTFIYDARTETLIAGTAQNGYQASCQAPRSGTTTYAFASASGTGLAQFTLNAPGSFIGVTDAPTSRVYRILSIDNTNMVLRAGRPTDDPVFTFKMRVK